MKGLGRVTAWTFANPFTRRRHLRWFQDQYTEKLARNPSAKFSFIGHSNGTYLFGESPKSLPRMQFEQAVLVGSVLPQVYRWDERKRLGQVKALRVDGSRYDWPVALLCNALRGIWMRDIGIGGYRGFTNLSGLPTREVFWYPGGHSDPLRGETLPALAAFAIEGQHLELVKPVKEAVWFSLLSNAMPYLAFGGFILLIWWLFQRAQISLAAVMAVVFSLLASF